MQMSVVSAFNSNIIIVALLTLAQTAEMLSKMAALQRQMATPFAIWPVLAIMPKLVEVRIGWICTLIAAEVLPLQRQVHLQQQVIPCPDGLS